MNNLIVVVGNIVDGVRHFGPFDSMSDVFDWVEISNIKEDWMAVELSVPTYQGRPVIPVMNQKGWR